MIKLINGRPMNDLVRDGRYILINDSKQLHICKACELLQYPAIEWMEILKPEPKPDAGGWWKFADKSPEKGQMILFSTNFMTTSGKYIDDNYTYTHWKLWEGPVD